MNVGSHVPCTQSIDIFTPLVGTGVDGLALGSNPYIVKQKSALGAVRPSRLLSM